MLHPWTEYASGCTGDAAPPVADGVLLQNDEVLPPQRLREGGVKVKRRGALCWLTQLVYQGIRVPATPTKVLLATLIKCTTNVKAMPQAVLRLMCS